MLIHTHTRVFSLPAYLAGLLNLISDKTDKPIRVSCKTQVSDVGPEVLVFYQKV